MPIDASVGSPTSSNVIGTGDAVVVGDAASEDDLGAVGERGALLAVAGATGDFLQLARQSPALGRAGGQRREREQDGRVEGLGSVAVVLERRVPSASRNASSALVKSRSCRSSGPGSGALRARERAGGELLAEVASGCRRRSTASPRELTGSRAAEDRRDLFERDQHDRVGVGREHLADLRVERRVTRVVGRRRDDLAAGGLEGLRDVAARPVPYESFSTIMPSVWLPSSAIRLPSTSPWSTSEGAVRKYRPLSSYVVKASRGVRRRELDDARADDLVDELQRRARRRGADDGGDALAQEAGISVS